MRTIGEILAGKRLREVVSVEAGETVLEAVRQMDEANTGAVVVLGWHLHRARPDAPRGAGGARRIDDRRIGGDDPRAAVQRA